MKKLGIVLGVILLILAVLPVKASSHEVRIFPVFSRTIVLEAGQVGVLTYRWLNTNYGLVQTFIKRIEQDFTIVGPSTNIHVTSVESRNYWGPIVERSDVCGDNKQAFSSRWTYNIGPLAPGEYEIHFVATSPGAFTDCIEGDNKPFIGTVEWDATITIIQQ